MVNPDQAMEWISSTGKKCGGIIGITKITSALCSWTLSYNLRFNIAYPTYTMYNICLWNMHLHDEAKKSRQKRGKEDESALLSTLNGFNVFSIFSHMDTLQILATKDLATAPIQDSLLLAKELEQEEINDFLHQRFIILQQHDKPDVSFHDIIYRNNAPTFSTLYKVVKNTKDKEKKVVLKADKNVLQRLITSYEAG